MLLISTHQTVVSVLYHFNEKLIFYLQSQTQVKKTNKQKTQRQQLQNMLKKSRITILVC